MLKDYRLGGLGVWRELQLSIVHLSSSYLRAAL